MHRIDGYGHTHNRFDVPKTEFTSEWLNSVQEELCTLLETFGVKLEKRNEGQVATLMQDIGSKMENQIETRFSAASKIFQEELLQEKTEVLHEFGGKLETLGKTFLLENEKRRKEIQTNQEALFAAMNEKLDKWIHVEKQNVQRVIRNLADAKSMVEKVENTMDQKEKAFSDLTVSILDRLKKARI